MPLHIVSSKMFYRSIDFSQSELARACCQVLRSTQWRYRKMGVSGADMLQHVCQLTEDQLAREHYMGTILIGLPKVSMASMPVPKRNKGLAAPVYTRGD